MSRDELDAGDVVVRVAYASVNYKDALTARGKAKIALKFPLRRRHRPGGRRSRNRRIARFKAGDEVIVHSFGLGADHDGGYAEYGRFPADWVIPLPKGLTLFEASALGVAGHTAALGDRPDGAERSCARQGQGAGERRHGRRGEHRHRHPCEAAAITWSR